MSKMFNIFVDVGRVRNRKICVNIFEDVHLEFEPIGFREIGLGYGI